MADFGKGNLTHVVRLFYSFIFIRRIMRLLVVWFVLEFGVRGITVFQSESVGDHRIASVDSV